MNNMPRRLAMALLVTTGSFASLLADNRLSIDNITVLENQDYVISVKMENDADITAVQAMLQLPQGMTIVRQYDQYAPTWQAHGKYVNFILNNTRTYGEEDKDEYGNALPRHEFNWSSQNTDAAPYDVQISHARLMPFKGKSGTEIFHFTVHTDNTLADLDSIGLTGIKFIRENAAKVKQDDFYAKVAKVDQVPFEPLLYFDGTQISVTPGEGQTTVEIKLRTNLDVRGVDATIKLPAGMKLAGYQAMNNSDVNKLLDIDANVIKADATGTTYRMAMSHRLPNHKVETVNGLFDDKVFAFVVSADDNLLDGSLIEFYDMDVVSTRKTDEGVNEEKVSPDFTILVNNPKVAVKAQEAVDLVDSLKGELEGIDVAPDTRASDDAEVKALVEAADQARQDAQDKVDELEAIVQAAVADGTVATPAKQAEIEAAKQAAVAAIQAAEDAVEAADDLFYSKYGANEEAYKRLNATIGNLQTRLNWSKDQLISAAPDVKDDFKGDVDAIQDDINNLSAAVKALYDAKKLTKETSIAEDSARIYDAITDLLARAAEEQKQYTTIEGTAATKLANKIDELYGRIDAADKDAEDNGVRDMVNAEADAADDAVAVLQTLLDENKGRLRKLTDSIDKATAAAETAVKALEDKVDAEKQAQSEEAAAAVKLKKQIAALNDSIDAAMTDAGNNGVEEDKVADEKAAADEAVAVLQKVLDENGGNLLSMEDSIANATATAETAVKALQDKVAAEKHVKDEENFANNLQVVINKLRDSIDAAETDAETSGVEDKVADEKAAADEAVNSVQTLLDENRGDLLSKAETVGGAVFAAMQAVKALEDKVAAEKQALQEEEAAAATSLANRIDILNGRIEAAKEKAVEFGVLAQADNAKTAAEAAVAALQTLYDENTGNLHNMADEIAERTVDANAAVKAFEDKVDELIQEQQSNDAARDEYQNQLDDLKERQEALAGELDALVSNNDNLLTDSSQQYKDVKQQLDECKEEDIDVLQNALTVGEDFTSDEAKALIEGALADIAGSLDAIEADIDALSKTKKRGNVTEDEDGDINISDYLAWIRQINKLETEEGLELRDIDVNSSEEYRKLDLNGDGKLTSADLRYLVNLVLSTDIDLNARIMSPGQESLTTTVQRSGNTQRIALNLSSSISYAAMQADVVLPEGMTFKQAELTERTGEYTLMVTHIGNKTRIRVITFNDITFKGTEGALLYIDLEGQGEARVQDVLLADVNAVDHELAVNAAETTGIDAARAEAGAGQVYSLSGRVMNALRKGINIIRRADGSTQKVIK